MSPTYDASSFPAANLSKKGELAWWTSEWRIWGISVPFFSSQRKRFAPHVYFINLLLLLSVCILLSGFVRPGPFCNNKEKACHGRVESLLTIKRLVLSPGIHGESSYPRASAPLPFSRPWDVVTNLTIPCTITTYSTDLEMTDVSCWEEVYLKRHLDRPVLSCLEFNPTDWTRANILDWKEMHQNILLTVQFRYDHNSIKHRWQSSFIIRMTKYKRS